MTLGVRLLAAGGKKELHYEKNPFVDGGSPLLVIATPAQIHGKFKAVTRTGSGTSIIVAPRPGLSLFVTDIIVSGEVASASNATIQYTDGVDTETIIVADQVVNAPTLPIPLTSYFPGWKDARVELVTSGNGDVTVTIGYIHSHLAPTFSEWDAER